MRISSSQVFDRATRTMGSLTEQADRLQTQISTGVRLLAPSTDAGAYRQLTGIRRATADETQDKSNITLATSLLSASDTALASIETQLLRASELTIQGASGSLSTEQKAVIAGQLDAILEDVVRLANSTDSRGSPLFSGSSEITPYTQASDGSVAYAGTGEADAIPIGDGATIQATTSGARIFGGLATAGGPSDAFAIIKGVADGLRSGAGVGTGIADIKTALTALGEARASIGARGARLDLETARLGEIAVSREEMRTAIEDTDITAAITELQKTLTVLQATQASFTKLTSLNLFDYLR